MFSLIMMPDAGLTYRYYRHFAINKYGFGTGGVSLCIARPFLMSCNRLNDRAKKNKATKTEYGEKDF